ncbi:SURF1 family protein [Methylopila sp. M107]|uniref:SURF1 family protein n=1 Tax=Methylopila sp. M107 TaxID=1101190 RepID=UPI00058C2063|nr:SURF1 family protein [Methylopila sp. M107]
MAGGLLAIGFASLGLWQIERRAWKLDLIERVETRAHAAASAPPGPEDWAALTSDAAEYRRVKLSGVFDHDAETLVQAVTDYGAGFWVLTPLKTDQGFTVLVNRGFVSPQMRDRSMRPSGHLAGPSAIAGLLRVSEPKGAFLRSNDPAADVWRSRDVAAIAGKRGLEGPVAPYFVDADATPNPGGWPIGGLTVIAFRNNHLIYALTWFALAAGTLIGAALIARHEVKRG